NDLAKLAKERELTDEEQAERHSLRQEYLVSVRKNMRATLDSVLIENDKGEYEPLKKRSPEQARQHLHHHGEGCTCGCNDHHEHHNHRHKHKH
ncbi:MAG: DUF896 domain-containing protein, partial [Bacillota bacterium]|nr:DUF896 domain-containing protein [Bacillota bacterium]